MADKKISHTKYFRVVVEGTKRSPKQSRPLTLFLAAHQNLMVRSYNKEILPFGHRT